VTVTSGHQPTAVQQHATISLVFPVLNDVAHGYLERNLRALSKLSHTEMICVDGGSADATSALAQRHGARCIVLEHSNRAQRINRGIQESQGTWVVLVHPRSLLDPACIAELLAQAPAGSWGAWTHAFDDRHVLLRFTSWYSNVVRGDLRSIFYLDHCLFIHRSLLTALRGPPVPEIPIFEDTELCFKLRAIQRGRRLPTEIRTSSVRFRTNGLLRQAAINQWSKLGWLLRRDLHQINRVYEAGLQLNERSDLGERRGH
jgi:glycosyltransferase involved in cell wall biosynthesis